MTRGEVMALIKHVFREAKLGIENTKETLMIGRMQYRCLGCSQPFASGVNRIRATKINHDALPPSEGLVPGTTLSRGGGRNMRESGSSTVFSGRKSLKPLQKLRSAPPRPKSAIYGKMFSPVSVRGHNNSR